MTTGPVPTIRLRRPPACDPPYDDERHPDAWESPAQPSLDLAATAPDRRPPAAASRPAGGGPVPTDVPPPEARTVAVRFVHTCLEIVNGLRPVNHVRALASPLEAGAILRTMAHATRRFQRTARHARADRPALVKLRRMRTCQPRPGILEIAAVIGTGDRVWAAAFRLEQRAGRWQCTAVNFL